MNQLTFNKKDLGQMKALGITEKEVRAHIASFKRGSFFQKLIRPCTLGDGIISISEKEIPQLLRKHQDGACQGRLLKFVPASGAASRMFDALMKALKSDPRLHREEIARKAEAGDQEAKQVLSFVNGITRFAFYDDLKSVLARTELTMDDVLAQGEYTHLIEALVTDRGLNYVNLPKGLLTFHAYPEGCRTALEEHLVEAIAYVQDQTGICRIHFTVSPEHHERFMHHFEVVKARYETKSRVRFHVDFSIQKLSTNTIAVDINNEPFREKDGKLVFRPGGHGALIENLNDIQGDIIYIKNIDNIVPDPLKGETFLWKKILGGLLIQIQEKIFTYLEKLERQKENKVVEEALEFAEKQLFILPPEKKLGSKNAIREFLLKKLNRPIRIGGMVKNQGEPGGGPFWVQGENDSLSLQTVENAQVDMKSAEQQKIWGTATHFSPVDFVCGVRDYKGNPFDLKRYVDQDAVFISQKSKDGRALKALELPGLWNGGMSDWISIFVEVPLITFNPVKTINDLLRKEHQP
ncbi:MAG TPA: DUF4301 family protein [Thermodesulfobacteriota bacterium]|nr:DUF4301 family protein [Thermodesulfobacteriota bacterium]